MEYYTLSNSTCAIVLSNRYLISLIMHMLLLNLTTGQEACLIFVCLLKEVKTSKKFPSLVKMERYGTDTTNVQYSKLICITSSVFWKSLTLSQSQCQIWKRFTHPHYWWTCEMTELTPFWSCCYLISNLLGRWFSGWGLCSREYCPLWSAYWRERWC